MAVYNHKLKNWGFLLKRFVQRNNIDQAFIFQPKGNKHGNLGKKTTGPAAFVMAGAILVTGDDYDSMLINYLQRREGLFEKNKQHCGILIKLAYYELMIHNYTLSEQLFSLIINQMNKGEGYISTIYLSAFLGLANNHYLRGHYGLALAYCHEVLRLGEESLEIGMAKKLKGKIVKRIVLIFGVIMLIVVVAVFCIELFHPKR